MEAPMKYLFLCYQIIDLACRKMAGQQQKEDMHDHWIYQ